jgi:hypothetical protein
MRGREIDDMMLRLPSQQPRESLRDRLVGAIICVVFFVLFCLLPDML